MALNLTALTPLVCQHRRTYRLRSGGKNKKKYESFAFSEDHVRWIRILTVERFTYNILPHAAKQRTGSWNKSKSHLWIRSLSLNADFYVKHANHFIGFEIYLLATLFLADSLLAGDENIVQFKAVPDDTSISGFHRHAQKISKCNQSSIRRQFDRRIWHRELIYHRFFNGVIFPSCPSARIS